MLTWIALVLTGLTGFSGLVYEVAWQKYVATLLGSHSEATAAVLALFLGGLSAGYAIFGRVTRRVVARATERGRPPRLLLLYGVVEASVGAHALVFPWLFAGVQALSLAIPHQVSGLGFALDVGLVALLILPPTMLMGATIPILTQALSKDLEHATRLHALVYASNTAGAFLGALLAGFVLVPWLGLEAVVRWMGGVNGVAGASFLLLGLRHRRALAGSDLEPPGGHGLGVYAPVALLSGFAAMALQTVLIRVGGLAVGSSQFTFSMMVAVFVLCIAVGSFAVSALPRIPRGLLVGVQIALALLLLLLYPVVGDSPYWVHVVRAAFRDQAIGFYFYYVVLFGVILTALAVPVGLSGATLPLVFHQVRQELGGLGAAAGRLYAWNTVGSLLGALLGGYLLLFWIDLDRVYVLAVGAIVLSAGLLVGRAERLRRWTVVGVVVALAALLQVPRWPPAQLAAGLFRLREPSSVTYAGPAAAFEALRPNYQISFYEDDPASSVTVMEEIGPDGYAHDVAIVTNGKPDGSIRGDYPTMALAGLLAALFAEPVERAFVIGFGTGVTVGELAALDSVEEVVVAEISPGVIEAARFFDGHNQGAISSPKTKVLVSDAYRALQSRTDRFDVIVSEPSNPWVAGVEMLYSQEFLRAARDRLTPRGVYAQWFHLYETDDVVVSLILRTYASVFDHVGVWYTLGPDLILLGFNDDDAEIDLDEIERRIARPDMEAGLRRARIDGLPALLAHEVLPLGVIHRDELRGPVHTLLHPMLNSRAAFAFFQGETAELPRIGRAEVVDEGTRNSLLARYRRRQPDGRLSDADYEAIARQLCGVKEHLCAATLAQWALDQPGSEAREQYLETERARLVGAPELEPGLLEDLGVLQGAAPLPDGRVPLAEAKRLTTLYGDYLHYGAPFDRGVLAEIWRRCHDTRGGVGCSESRRTVEKRYGPLRESVAAASGS